MDRGKSLQLEVIVPTSRRPWLLLRCLRHVNKAIEHAGSDVSIKVLICISGDDRVSRELVEQETYVGETEILYFAENLTAAQARNRLLGAARGDWLFLLDDDAYVPERIFANFRSVFKHYSSAIAMGGPNLTPPNSSFFQMASGLALGSRFGSYRSARRYCMRPIQAPAGEENLTSCNLFLKRGSLAANPFPEFMPSNEENWLLQELSRRKLEFVYHPLLFVWHERRENFVGFLRQIFRYGIGRGMNIRYKPLTCRYFHIVPAVCVLFTIFAFSMARYLPGLLALWLLSACLYFIAWCMATLRIRFRSEGPALALVAGALLPVIHICYGAGTLRGAMRDG